MSSPISLIITREYLERTRRKSFIITTLLVPLLMLLLMAAPTLIMFFSTPEKRVVSVVDNTGVLFKSLKGNDEIAFVNATLPVDSLRKDADSDIILVIGPNAVKAPDRDITLLTRGSLSMMTDQYISDQLKTAIEDERLKDYNISNLREIMKRVHADVSYPTIRIDGEEDSETSSILSYGLSMAMDMVLYMFIIIYGQMVMTSIIEEKTNRVLEIVVSSVKPAQLMLGKIIGIGLVAITQILIWAVIALVCSSVAIPFMVPAEATAEIPELSGVVAQLGDLGFIVSLIVYTLLFFIGGFLFYASIYAAIGSAVSNVQDASQLSTIATMPVIVGIVASMSIMNNPGSTLAFWISIFPFTSPMAMMSRIPFGVPFWQIGLSLVLLYASFLFMIWICAKIYRIGIFMYGKKPTLMEIIKWAKY
ncbi:MAG: ABC transporter permease [Candidatus Amulumruptor caecigallinarius]|nr:ABC transporter permease [Candidatus Amulumruptor caecigallinarius]